jgi:hypothetical protein
MDTSFNINIFICNSIIDFFIKYLVDRSVSCIKIISVFYARSNGHIASPYLIFGHVVHPDA